MEEGHATYEQLQEPSIPIYKDFYFFNLTNFEEFAASYGNATPIFHEVGPYSYLYVVWKGLEASYFYFCLF